MSLLSTGLTGLPHSIGSRTGVLRAGVSAI